MIGILLALQVNNWNEGRKNIKKEVIYLQNFKKDLEFEISRQKETLNKTAYKISVFKALDPSFDVWANMTNHITENINLDSIRLVDVFRRGSNNRFVNGTYSTLKDNGDIRLIRNEELYLKIVFIYNNHLLSATSIYQDLKKVENELRFKYSKELKYSNVQQTFFTHPNKRQIKADLTYYYEIFSLRYHEASRALETMEEALALINQELNN